MVLCFFIQLLEQKPDKKDMILKYMRDSLQSIVQKEVLSFTCVHHLLFEYMKFAGPIDKQVFIYLSRVRYDTNYN